MIDQRPNPHLAYDDLLRTLVDQSDLSPEHRAHLADCARCRRQAEALKLRYKSLGNMARHMAPSPTRSFRVPQATAPKIRWQIKPGVALAALGVLAFVFTVWWPKPSDDLPGPDTIALVQPYDALEEAQFMAEVEDLVHDALPKAYQQLVAVSEPILSEDLIDWIVPSIEEDIETDEPRA